MKQVVIIGAGIVGSFIAYNLTKYDNLKVTLIEKHNDVAEEISKANSAIVHAGYDPKDGTLKALLNKRGADLYPSICKELGCDYVKCGAYVVAKNYEEVKVLDQLYKQGMSRNIHMEYVDREEMCKEEPHLKKEIMKGLWVPDTAIITPWEVCQALVEEALLNGLDLRLNEKVSGIKEINQGYLVCTNTNEYKTDMVINCAGLHAQEIMQMIEDTCLFTITPKRGQYYVLSKNAKKFVKHIIYPAPSKVGKGVLVVPTIHGNVLLGPTSEVLDHIDLKTTKQGLDDVRLKLNHLIDDIPYQEIIHSYSGCRPLGNHGDFYIEESKDHPGVIHLGCIDSPGLASAPAISEYVMNKFIANKIDLKEKKFLKHRNIPVVMSHLNDIEKNTCLVDNPLYGHIVCFCEKISEQEVINCIHRPCGATSIMGVKKRVRPGMGKCQGGYCESFIAKILARELNIPLSQVKYDEDSYYFVSKEASK